MNNYYPKIGCILLLLLKVLQAQVFTNVVQSQGILVENVSTDILGSAVSFYDFNQDGWDDLSFALESDTQAFFLNNQGNFVPVDFNIFNPGETKMLLWVDYDNDGDLDLLLTTQNGQVKLWQNDGVFNFTDVTILAGISTAYADNFGASFGDYDRDGDLDLYICRYTGFGDSTDLDKVNNLYRNEGDGTFTNVTWQAGVSDGLSPSFQSVWVDYNKDGWPDLFVVNDRNNWKNGLYLNNTDGTFTSVADVAGVTMLTAFPMTGSFADFDNDNDLDLFVSSSATFLTDLPSFFVNQNDGTFIDEALQYNLQLDNTTFGGLWLDYDNDLDQDLYVATDWLYNAPVQARNYFMVNEYPSPFVDDSTLMMGLDTASSHAVARGDFNRDGFYDIAVHTDSPSKGQLWLNSPNANNYIRISLEGTISNKMAIGSWIKVFINGQQYTQYTFCGENYLGQNSQHHVIGVGAASKVDSVYIEYLSGIVDKFYNLDVNQSYHFVEGISFESFALSYNGPPMLCAGDTAEITAPSYSSYLWSTGDTTQSIDVLETGAYSLQAYDALGNLHVSNEVNIEFVELPEINTLISSVTCAHANDGAIALDISNAGIPYNTTWNTGATGDTLVNLIAGSYSFTYQDSLGCIYQDSFQIQEPFPINVQRLIQEETSHSLGAIVLLINGGLGPYQVFLDSVLTTDSIVNLSAGTYLLEVLDANGCSWYEEIEIQYTDTTIQTPIIHLRDMEVSLYPMPFTETFAIVFVAKEKEQMNAFLYDIDGNEVFSKNYDSKLGLNSFQIRPINAIASGAYILKIAWGDEICTKIVSKR